MKGVIAARKPITINVPVTSSIKPAIPKSGMRGAAAPLMRSVIANIRALGTRNESIGFPATAQGLVQRDQIGCHPGFALREIAFRCIKRPLSVENIEKGHQSLCIQI